MKKWTIIAVMMLAVTVGHAQKWYQIGFRAGSQFPLNREYTASDHLSTLRTVHFGGYFRAGKYVYGEIGLGYQYFKNRFEVTEPTGVQNTDLVENRYLVIPIRAVGDVQITKKISFMPQVGILYQPLLKVTANTLGYTKQTFEPHWALLTTGFDFRFGFITLGVDYRYSFQHYFRNQEGQRPQYIGINAGVLF